MIYILYVVHWHSRLSKLLYKSYSGSLDKICLFTFCTQSLQFDTNRARASYSVMQLDGNSLKKDNFQEVITSELISSLFENSYLFVYVSGKSYVFVQNLYKHVIHKLQAHEKCWSLSCSHLIASHYRELKQEL